MSASTLRYTVRQTDYAGKTVVVAKLADVGVASSVLSAYELAATLAAGSYRSLAPTFSLYDAQTCATR